MNIGAQACKNRLKVASVMAADVSNLGESREVIQLRGMARAILPQCDAEPSRPCWLGERLSSALIAGSKIPSVFRTMKEDTLENSHVQMTIQRYLL